MIDLISQTKIKKSFLTEIQDIVGPEGYSITAIDRLNYARDANTRSTIKAHYHQTQNFPELIVWPRSSAHICSLVKCAAKHKVPITPFAGGSGVCGGAEPQQKGGLILDVKRLNQVIKVDPERLVVEVEAGILAYELEKQLSRKGFTLGHYPSSILTACLAGFLATRSAGQYSSKYGKIEDMVIDLEFVDGRGRLHQTSDVSRSRGIDLTQLIVGSEGTLGIITKARLKIYPKPQERLMRTFVFDQFSYGLEAARRIMQTGIKPDAIRLYDPLETAFVLTKISRHKIDLDEELITDRLPELLTHSLKALKSNLFHWLFKSHRLVNEFLNLTWNKSVMICALEGHPEIMAQQMEIIKSINNDLNATDIGESIAEHWYQNRYSVSFEASNLFQDGAFVDTMEVATTWDNFENLLSGLKKELKPHCFLLTHVAHVYEEGAALYLTMIAPLNGAKRSLKKLDKIWEIALNTTQKLGGVISHHHGIGRLKKDQLRLEWGDAKNIYLNLKNDFDPENILNPNTLYAEVS